MRVARTILFLLVAVFCVVHAQNETEHERDKRFSPIVTFYENLNYGADGGASLTVDDSNVPIWSSFVTLGLNNKFSSIKFYPTSTNWYTRVCKDVNRSGTCWGFRSIASIPDLRDFGLNNDIESMQSNWVGPSTAGGGNCGVTVYQHSDYGGKSIYISPGNHPDITNAAWLGFGSFPNDAVSSVHLLPYTRVTFYKNKNPDWLYGEKFIYTCYPGNPYMQNCMVPSLGNKNDWVSALSVQCL